MFGGDPAVCDGNPTPNSPNGRVKPGKVADRHEQLVKAMTAAVAEGVAGDVMQIPTESGVPIIKSRKTYEREIAAVSGSGGMSKSVTNAANARLADYFDGPSATQLAKEWTLTNPISTGLVPYDLRSTSETHLPPSDAFQELDSEGQGTGCKP